MERANKQRDLSFIIKDSLSRRSTVLLIVGLTFSFPPNLNAENPSVTRFSITEFVVEGDNPLSKPDIDKLLAPFRGDQENMKQIDKARRKLQDLLNDKGYTSHRVILPEQTLRDGIATLRIIAFKIGKIEVKRDENGVDGEQRKKFFSNANILTSVSALQSGKVANTKGLSRQLMLANAHPRKKTTVKFRESEIPQAIDAEVRVKAYDPYGIFASVNNHHSRGTPNTRVTVGVQHSNLLDLDHTFTASYTTSPEDTGRVKQYGFNYKAPIYFFGGALDIYFIRSDVDTGRVAGFFDVSGKGKFLGGGYKQHFVRLGRYSHSTSLRVDDKLFENDVSFAGTAVGTDVRSRPLSLQYQGKYNFNQANAGFYLAYVRNLPGGADNDDEAYAASRFGGGLNV